jgi:hypothetical protein
MLPPFCRTHGNHDDKASGLTVMERESTDLTFAAVISNHSRLARRFVLAAAYGSRFQLWGARIDTKV